MMHLRAWSLERKLLVFTILIAVLSGIIAASLAYRIEQARRIALRESEKLARIEEFLSSELIASQTSSQDELRVEATETQGLLRYVELPSERNSLQNKRLINLLKQRLKKIQKQLAHDAEVPDIVKADCQRLVEGELLFEPSRNMREGQFYDVFARLTRTPGVDIAQGIAGRNLIIAKEKVSCKVTVNLDAEEPNAFSIEKVPKDRKDEQVLESDSFSPWDWHVTPKKHGELHLLLYVTPMLYVEGIGEQLKPFPQPPRVITVTPDYVYEFKAFISDNWTILGVLLTAVFIPLFLWFRTGIIDWLRKRFENKGVFYSLPKKRS